MVLFHYIMLYLQDVLGHLMNFESRRGQDDIGLDDEQNKYAVSLYNGGGVDVSLS